MALTPVPFSNRVGLYLVAGGSSAIDAYGRVSTNLIGLGETWADVSGKDVITEAFADGVRAISIRCPRGIWLADDGTEFLNHCNKNGVPVPVPGPFHALNIAATKTHGARLATGFDSFLSDLNGDGWAISVYNNGLPNYEAPADDNAIHNWQTDPLTQGNGYPDIDDVTDLDFVRALYADELDYGATEFAFDGTGQDRATCMLSNALFPMLVEAGTHTHADFDNDLLNDYARMVCVEANSVRETAYWQTPYTFCARYPEFEDRIGDHKYLQPSEMAYTPAVFFQTSTADDYAQALRLAPSYRVWVKWESMKATVGADAMAALLAAGASSIVTPTVAGSGVPVPMCARALRGRFGGGLWP